MNMMPKRGGAAPEEGTAAISPYTAGRRVWNERYGDAYAQAANWRLFALGCLAVSAVAVAGNVWLASQVKVVPYLVQTDHLGQTLAAGRAIALGSHDELPIRDKLMRWIEDVRTVSTDQNTEAANVAEAYAALDKKSPAFDVVNGWFSASNPYQRAARESVTVKPSYLEWRGGLTWRVGWREQVHPQDGAAPPPKDIEADITVKVDPPNTDAGILANASGIFVTNLNWYERK